jgi:tetratricopeptide (TPR) repeat protein
MVLGTATIRATLGELAVAMGLADDAEEVALLTRNQQWLTWALTLRTWIATLTGDVALAQRSGERAIAAGASISEHYYSLLSRCFLATSWLEDGQPDRCVDAVLAACEGPELPPIKRPFRGHVYELLTRAELARGRPRQAANWASRAREAVADVPLGGHRAEALRAQAAVALAQGRPSDAATLAAAATQAAATAGRAIDAARGGLLTGTALAEMGARPKAIEHLQRAFEGFRTCGARRLEDAAAEKLRALGAPPPCGHRAADNPGDSFTRAAPLTS